MSEADIDAVIDVLRSKFLTQGPVVPAFEKSVAEKCGAKHAVAVHSATAGLHVACLALGVGPGDIVWTSPITFVASANCARYCGAEVDFVDIDPLTYNMSVPALRNKLIAARGAKRLPKVVIPVHLTGQPCQMSEIHELAGEFGFRVIEDASHAIGARYRGVPVGNCKYSDITVFSFHPVKIITTGEGGMAVTNDPGLARSMERFRSHGITRDEVEMTHASEGPWYYQQLNLGFNYRMTDLQAALGLSQMGRLDTFIHRRTELAARYSELLEKQPLRLPWEHPESASAWHLYVVRVDSSKCRFSKREQFCALREAGIGVNLHYIPVYLQPYYQALGFRPGLCPEAERYYAEAISIPIYFDLKNFEQDLVIEALAELFD